MPSDELQILQEDVQMSPEVSAILEAGVFYGRKKTKTHPRMKQYVLTNRGGIEIIDPNVTLDKLLSALAFLKERVRSGALFLVVATQPAAESARALAKELNLPYVSSRWVGGTLTNFDTIAQRINHFKTLKEKRASGELEKYTKKERVGFEKEIRKLEEAWSGLESLSRRPDALLMIDPEVHSTAIREARRLRIPIVAFASTDADPDLVDFVVPGNSAAPKSIAWFVGEVRRALDEARQELSAAPTAAAAEPPEKLNEAGSDA